MVDCPQKLQTNAKTAEKLNSRCRVDYSARIPGGVERIVAIRGILFTRECHGDMLALQEESYSKMKSESGTRHSSSSVEGRWIEVEDDSWQTRSRFTDGCTRSAQNGSFGKSLKKYEVD